MQYHQCEAQPGSISYWNSYFLVSDSYPKSVQGGVQCDQYSHEQNTPGLLSRFWRSFSRQFDQDYARFCFYYRYSPESLQEAWTVECLVGSIIGQARSKTPDCIFLRQPILLADIH